MDEGDYSLVTGTRLANGGVLAEMQMFHVEKGGTTVIDMHLRTSSTEVTVIGNFDSESKFMLLTSPEENGGSFASATANAQEVSLLSQTGRGYFITGVIGVGQEPTNHALKDIAKVAQVLRNGIVLSFSYSRMRRLLRNSESLNSLDCQRISSLVSTRMGLSASRLLLT